VQILMNDHLTRKTDPAWRLLENAFGTSTARTSFAHRCHRGCRGGGVLHTKMYLFDSTTPVLSANRIRNTVLFGSSNMTSNAAKIQWNDLYGVRNDTSGLYKQFSRMFDLMKADNGYHRNPTLGPAGPFRATFWPAPAGSTDAYLTGLRSVSCTGVSGAGIGGRTVLYINMHAWFGTRGLALANQARRLYNRGCYVRVLYSFMSYGVYKKLHVGTGSRMSVRRTIFSHNGRTAYVYSHLKSIAISGNVAGNRSARVVWTGSNNFTNEGLNFDEVSVRIASASAYNSYARWFKYMSARKSSPVYANYSEPEGGGRAPKRTTAARAIASPSAPADAPTVVSPDVRVSDSGELSVPD
jgi:phosphatidylserine/phosphatidylglycerophosphate/cardiolipin synthase-like enzyme